MDDTVYRIAVDEANAQLETACIELAALRSTYRQKLAQIDEAAEQAAYSVRELRRQEILASGDVATEAELDKARHVRAESDAGGIPQPRSRIVCDWGGGDCLKRRHAGIGDGDKEAGGERQASAGDSKRARGAEGCGAPEG